MAPALLTAEVFYTHPRSRWHHLPVALWAWEKHPIPPWRRVMIGDLPALGETVDTPQAFAYVNHGRWLADCPFCGSPQIASLTDRRMICTGASGCGNAQAGGAFVRVLWPDEHEAIEAALVQRPDVATRNWLPGETVDGLRRENTARGLRRVEGR